MIVIFIGRKLYTLPRGIWDDINENLDPVIAAVATVLMLATLSGLLLERYLRGAPPAAAPRHTRGAGHPRRGGAGRVSLA